METGLLLTGFLGLDSQPMASRVHRTLFEALGEPQSLKALKTEVWFSDEAWRKAVQRLRETTYAEVTDAEAHWAIGDRLAERFLASQVGQLVSQALPVLSFHRIFGDLAPRLFERQREGFTYHWESTDRGIEIRLLGPFVLPAEVTAGALLHLARRADASASVEILSSSPEALRFEVRSLNRPSPGP